MAMFSALGKTRTDDGEKHIHAGKTFIMVDATLNNASGFYNDFNEYMKKIGFRKVDLIQTAWCGEYESSGKKINDFLQSISNISENKRHPDVEGHAMIQIGNQCVIFADIKITRPDDAIKVKFIFNEMLLSRSA